MSSAAETAALAAFLDWARPRALPGSEPERRRLAAAFLAACYGDLGKEPRLLEPEDWPELLGRALPSRLSHKDPAGRLAPQLLPALLEHLGERVVVPYAYELSVSFEQHLPAFERALAAADLPRRPLGPSTPLVHKAPKLGRNEACFCGSGTKFKQCHGKP
jgi:hypothetical protein